MSSGQKLIKTVAICFAIFLIANMIGGIFWVLSFFSRASWTSREDYSHYEETYDNVSAIEVDVISSSVMISQGDTFQVVADVVTDSFSSSIKNGTLKVQEKKVWFGSFNGTIHITVPNTVLSQLKVNAGAGEITIDSVKSRDLDVDQGAGILTIYNSLFDHASIDGGAGALNISSSVITDLDLDTGVGKVEIDALLYGKNEIECGVGEVLLHLGTPEDYQITVEKGLGTIIIDGMNQKDGAVFGSGNNLLSIEGGVGNINVDFREASLENY